MDKLIFVIVHHSTSKKDTELLIECIQCIRNYYPINNIKIIKTSTTNIPYEIIDSNIEIYNKINDNSFIIGCLPILEQICDDDDNYILIHDSMYIVKELPELLLKLDIYTLWDFDSNFDFNENEFNIILKIFNIDYPEILIDLYRNKYSKTWKGCFGPAFGGKISFLKKMINILNLDKSLQYFEGRQKLMLTERIIPLIINYINIIHNNNDTLYSLSGSIYKHPNFCTKNKDISISNIQEILHITNYNAYFYKLWCIRE